MLLEIKNLSIKLKKNNKIIVKNLEVFRKKTGFTNLKLLVYNSYLINPVLIFLIFFSGEYKKIY